MAKKRRELTAKERKDILQKYLDREIYYIFRDLSKMPVPEGQKHLQERLKILKELKELIEHNQNNVMQNKKWKWIKRVIKWISPFLSQD